MTVITPGLINDGSITNAQLTNDSVTINTNSLSLGGSLTLDTDDIGEGTGNLYFTDERVDDRLNNLLVEGDNITLTYDDTANTLTIAADNTGGFNLANNSVFDLSDVSGSHGAGKLLVNTGSGFSATNVDTDDFVEGTTNLFHTTQRAYDSVVTNFDAFDVGAYDSTGIQIKNDGTRWPVIELRQYGSGTFGIQNPGIFCLSTEGSDSSPTALQSGDRIFALSATAHNGGIPTTANCQMTYLASENQSSTNRGASCDIETTADGDTSRTTTATFHGDNTTLINLIASGTVVFSNLPTTDPTNAGQLWNDSGTLKVSAG